MRSRRDYRPDMRALMLTALLAASAATICALAIVGRPALPAQTHVPWWLLALAFAVCEVFVIHVDRGVETHTFSLMEVPLVVGLYLVSPVGLVIARLVGSGAALAVHRRQAARKLSFNLSLFALETSLAALMFRSVVGEHTGVGPRSWGAALLACLLANCVGALGVSAVIAITTGGLQRTAVRRMLVEGVALGPLANTSLALVATVVLWYEPVAALLLVSLVMVLVVAYRAYSALSRRYANLQRLYAFTRETQRQVDGTEAVVNMLQAARRLLNADRAELVVVDAAGRTAMRTRVHGAGSLVEGPLETSDLGPLWQLYGVATDGIVVPRATTVPQHRDVLQHEGWKDCLIAAFGQDGGVRGMMALADCSGDVNSFDAEDLSLFTALVNHALVSLENSRLVGQLQHEALHDMLTGLPNRTLFNRRVQAAIQARRPGEKVAVLLMDLDRFKEVNDTLGHHHGDRLLIGVCDRLGESAPEGAVVARLGGDEFAVLLAPTDDPLVPFDEARALAAALAAPFALEQLQVAAGASIGIAICPDHGEDPITLLQRADVAMYAGKSSGHVEVYSPDRDNHSTRRLAMVGELRSALEVNALELFYQPKADALSGLVTGVEALIRWNHPERGWVSPDELIPIAESSGLIVPLTAFVLGEVTRQWRAWHDSGLDFAVAVNVSMRSLQDPGFVEQITDALGAADMPAPALTLEITESAIMTDPTRTLHIIDALAAEGIKLSIDDFGTGYSSLTYLRQLPLHEVKLDRSFVSGMNANSGDAAIVRSVIDLGRNLGLIVVAEGVETDESWRQLADWGCHMIQGYRLSHPLPPALFVEWFKRLHAGRSLHSVV